MMNFTGRTQHLGAIAGLLAAALLFTAGSALANPEMGGDHCMSGGGNGHGMEMGGGMDHGMRGMQPHNAAEHFLKMGPLVKLTDEQTKQLTKLRDDYIEKNAVAEQQLKAAYEDLGKLLFADDVDIKAVNTLLEKIGKMDAQLWHAFAQQLHDIKAMMTAEQKQSLKSLWEERHPGMGGGPGDMSNMPMDRGTMH
jgi:Spy/CpxP family protein refolding chaperone